MKITGTEPRFGSKSEQEGFFQPFGHINFSFAVTSSL